MGGEIAMLVVGGLFTAGLFIILRVVFLWYWRIDTIVKNQEETNRILGRLLAKAEDNDRDKQIED